jgi:hypothetical protein
MTMWACHGFCLFRQVFKNHDSPMRWIPALPLFLLDYSKTNTLQHMSFPTSALFYIFFKKKGVENDEAQGAMAAFEYRNADED